MIAVGFFQINVGWHKINVNHGSDTDSKAAPLFDPGMLFEKPTERVLPAIPLLPQPYSRRTRTILESKADRSGLLNF